ncbi:hypothetical protein FUAX_11380 [Fulvitalea axinellae]|uniref:Uncharacterized protein n=1 Tax=Fulvitalea axinellae TaxID=1182444 RepID=A0AAU9C995_9BACT|nr:hypothetical protein FUAX_11380 [Fulvitalea axinellae]
MTGSYGAGFFSSWFFRFLAGPRFLPIRLFVIASLLSKVETLLVALYSWKIGTKRCRAKKMPKLGRNYSGIGRNCPGIGKNGSGIRRNGIGHGRSFAGLGGNSVSRGKNCLGLGRNFTGTGRKFPGFCVPPSGLWTKLSVFG